MDHYRHVNSRHSSSRAFRIMVRTILLLSLLLPAPCGAQQLETDKLLASDGGMYDEFGFSVALDGTNALVGAYVTESSIGSAYLFRCDDVAGIWIEEAELVASDGVSGDRFGWSVSLSGMRALIGAPRCEDNGDDSGAAYLFYFDSSAGTWQEEAKLLASDGGSCDNFG